AMSLILGALLRYAVDRELLFHVVLHDDVLAVGREDDALDVAAGERLADLHRPEAVHRVELDAAVLRTIRIALRAVRSVLRAHRDPLAVGRDGDTFRPEADGHVLDRTEGFAREVDHRDAPHAAVVVADVGHHAE